jgi:hypothetical protein
MCRFTPKQQDKVKAWISETLPRTTRQIGAWIEREYGIDYHRRSILIALLHRLEMEHRKPKAISRKLDPAKQEAFIKADNALLKQLSADQAVIFAAPCIQPMRYARWAAGHRKTSRSRSSKAAAGTA